VPRIVSVVVNGNIAALAGTQRSRIASVVTVFDQAVQVDPNAFTLGLHTQSVTYNDVDMPNGYGALPMTLIVTPSADRKTWIVTFAGNTDDGVLDGYNSLKDGVYDFRVNGAKVHPLGAPSVSLGADRVTTFHRFYGDNDLPDEVPLGLFGSDFEAMVLTRDNLLFRPTVNRPANYKAYLDFNGDGAINSFDNLQFRTRFNKALTWRA
jgi:hypothetical protein